MNRMALPSSTRTDKAVKKAAGPCFLRVSISASEPSRSVPSAKLVLVKVPKPWRKKGHCDVASLWFRALDDGNAMGMCDGEWYTAA